MTGSERRSPGFSTDRFSTNRRMVAANSALAMERHAIHLVTEVDVTEVRRLFRDHKARTGAGLSFTAYVTSCLGQTLGEYPSFNSFRKGRKLYLLDDITISVAIEREVDGQSIPQPVAIHAINSKTFLQVHEEIRQAQRAYESQTAPEQSSSLMRFVPDWALRAFVRLVTKDPGVAQHVGVVGVSSIGMFASGSTWLVPLSPTTVMLSVGSMVRRPALVDGVMVEREFVCLTGSFDHDIVDGAPAARFMARLGEMLTSGEDIKAIVGGESGHSAGSSMPEGEQRRGAVG